MSLAVRFVGWEGCGETSSEANGVAHGKGIGVWTGVLSEDMARGR